VQLQDSAATIVLDSVYVNQGVLDLNGHTLETDGVYIFPYTEEYEAAIATLAINDGILRIAFGIEVSRLTSAPFLSPPITGPGTIEVFGSFGDPYLYSFIGWVVYDPMDTTVVEFPVVRHTGTNALLVGGNNTFSAFESLSAAGGVSFILGETSTFGAFDVSGAPGNLKTLSAEDGGYLVATQATLLKSTTWFVGANSVDDGNNTGLIFTAGGINDYLAISNIIGGGSGTTYATDVIEGVDLSDAAVAAEIKPTSVQESVEAQDATAVVVSDLVWSEFDDSQTPNWQNVDNTQVPTWTPVDDSQTPGWTPVTP
jgi:hypothetical protein